MGGRPQMQGQHRQQHHPRGPVHKAGPFRQRVRARHDPARAGQAQDLDGKAPRADPDHARKRQNDHQRVKQTVREARRPDLPARHRGGQGRGLLPQPDPDPQRNQRDQNRAQVLVQKKQRIARVAREALLDHQDARRDHDQDGQRHRPMQPDGRAAVTMRWAGMRHDDLLPIQHSAKARWGEART